MAYNHKAAPASVYVRCVYPSGAELDEGQVWNVVKYVPVSSPIVKNWFKAMADAVKRRRNKQ